MAAITLMAGCGEGTGTGGRTGSKPTGVEDVLQAQIAQAEGGTGETAEGGDKASAAETADAPQNGFIEGSPKRNSKAAKGEVLSATEGIDVDLTALSGVVVYSEVYNMMYAPEDYIGKTIKMVGLFAVYQDEITGNYYYACIIEDATACCAQGIEFVLTDDYSYPDDYPQEGETVTVIGVFDTYMEDGYLYATLRDAKLV